ncbi:MAG: DNA topoisomerase, partial [Actinomycetota bacterium]|nr:DNA topoisomerase [Actinomycetota bacterium]
AAGGDGSRESVDFVASGRVIKFFGFLKAYVEGADDPETQAEDSESHLPALSEGDKPVTESVEAAGHTTQPPARYTEASLVRALEELGVGRPSTYASIIGTIQDRGYVWKKGAALVPSFVAFAVVGLLEQHFGDLVDYGFTASMEDALDLIAGGREEAVPYLSRFYFGNGRPGLKTVVGDHLADIDAREVNSIHIGKDAEGAELVVRVGRYGPYVQRGEQRAPVPDDMAPDELTVDRAEQLLEAPSGDRELGTDPTSGSAVLVRAGRFGPYVQLGQPEPGSKEKPVTASLLSSMTVESVTLEDALRLLSLPRSLGADPGTGEEVVVANGRFGPYVKRGSDTRSLADEQQLFSLELEGALQLLAQPKTRGRRAPAAPLKELGPDPVTGGQMVVREGRFGPYVTDGETNASLKRGDTPEHLTPERAAELLADRRAAGPPQKRPRRSSATSKAATSKSGTSKAATAKAGSKASAKAATSKSAAGKRAGGKTSSPGSSTS